MIIDVYDAFDLLTHAAPFDERLRAAKTELAKIPGREEEGRWLDVALAHVRRAALGAETLVVRAVRLPELASLRAEYGKGLQAAAVAAFSDLQAAIAKTAGERSPLIEALYRNLRAPAGRRVTREEFAAFLEEFEKRLESRYAKRMLDDPDYGATAPAVRAVRSAFAEWRAMFDGPELSADEADALRREVKNAARTLDLPWQQARLLAEAALLPEGEILEKTGLLEKPKRRAGRLGRAQESIVEDADVPEDERGSAPSVAVEGDDSAPDQEDEEDEDDEDEDEDDDDDDEEDDEEDDEDEEDDDD